MKFFSQFFSCFDEIEIFGLGNFFGAEQNVVNFFDEIEIEKKYFLGGVIFFLGGVGQFFLKF